MSNDFRKDLEHIINCHSKENGSNTPDFILANFLLSCLHAFDHATNWRSEWYGHDRHTDHAIPCTPPDNS